MIQQIYGTLFALANKIQSKGDTYFEDITSRQFMIMMAIIHLPEEEATIINIAKKLGTTKQSARHLLSSIESKGYVVAIPSPVDRRAVNVKITESGKKVLLKCGGKSIHFLADLSGNFTKEELEQIWTLLKKLYQFDGEKQDGFEESISIQMGDEQDEMTKKALEEFSRRRNAQVPESNP
ncbi:MarR family winged helix-turn-helix transcriptional regulator [Paenibacillus tianmuensis]|uniref:MarR family winged helix-turn-helix transcriptional regulator n=1 Tax=Paenibacillus tianmuensis TaxID=624147 RepID=UPI001FDFE524|nr:MarR family transcriptional regulator [Paenibacillus tianmuensis]